MREEQPARSETAPSVAAVSDRRKLFAERGGVRGGRALPKFALHYFSDLAELRLGIGADLLNFFK